MDDLPVNLPTGSQHGDHVYPCPDAIDSSHRSQPQSPLQKHYSVGRQPLAGYLRGDQSIPGKQSPAHDLPPAGPYQPPTGKYSVDPQHLLLSTNHLQGAATFRGTGQPASGVTPGSEAASTERHFSIDAAIAHFTKLIEELARQQQHMQQQLFQMASMENAMAPHLAISLISTALQNEPSTIEVSSLDQSAYHKSLDLNHPLIIEPQQNRSVDAKVLPNQCVKPLIYERDQPEVMQYKRSTTSPVVQILNFAPQVFAATPANQIYGKHSTGINPTKHGHLFPPRVTGDLHQHRFSGHEPSMIASGNIKLKPPWPPPASYPVDFLIILFINCPTNTLRGGRERHSEERYMHQNKRSCSARSEEDGVKSAPSAVFDQLFQIGSNYLCWLTVPNLSSNHAAVPANHEANAVSSVAPSVVQRNTDIDVICTTHIILFSDRRIILSDSASVHLTWVDVGSFIPGSDQHLCSSK